MVQEVSHWLQEHKMRAYMRENIDIYPCHMLSYDKTVYGSSMVWVWFKYGSIWFKYGLGMVQESQ